MKPRTALVLGGTGVVGRALVEQLLRETLFVRVVAPTRRPVEPPAHLAARLRQRLDAPLIDFNRIGDRPEMFNGVTHVFCALGTTIRQAGSRAQFRRVDHGYPLAAGRLALQLGASHYLLVSAIGADPASRVFYNRVKGEVERDIRALRFPAVTIVRPSLLLGSRNEFRLSEQLARRLAWLAPSRWAPVEARDVAATLVASSLSNELGTRVIESAQIRHTTSQSTVSRADHTLEGEAN